MFIDDKEKMQDFAHVEKDEFLEIYSYLTEQEYDDTAKEIERLYRGEVFVSFNEDMNRWELIRKDGDIVIGAEWSVVCLVNRYDFLK